MHGKWMYQTFYVYNVHIEEVCNVKLPLFKKRDGHLNGRQKVYAEKPLLVTAGAAIGISLNNAWLLIWIKKSKKVLKQYHPSTSIPTLQAVVSRVSISRGLIGQSDHNCQKTFGTKWQHSFNL